MNAPDRVFLPDVQSSADARQLAIQHVGVKGLRYPLVLDCASGAQATVAVFDMDVALPPEQKGTHMSRFVELLEGREGPVALRSVQDMLRAMLLRLDAVAGRISMRFPYFLRKSAPVSGVSSLIDIEAAIEIEQREGAAPELTLEVAVPVTSLCPCSKEISAYGAHNQRSVITLRATLASADDVVELDELVRIAESQASCAVFGLLKRPDEKWVTERAYENPKFVEDLVRDVALQLRQDARIRRWQVASENFESIHNHSAYALIHGENGVQS